jgi:hypothetical protein
MSITSLVDGRSDDGRENKRSRSIGSTIELLDKQFFKRNVGLVLGLGLEVGWVSPEFGRKQ